ncbi:MAG TPA: 2-oxoglutarate dehydrogenase E1 component [Longimicrobiales bacterium]|nr:2-oxoglutarate dehydrogenase E1 component [Longimicrobiales bacterium]
MLRNAFDTYNAAYVQAMFEQYLQNPSSVDEAWRQYFAGEAGTRGLLGADGRSGETAALPDAMDARAATRPAPPDITELRAARAAGELVDAYRLHGHRAARLDPLGSEPPGHPMLEPGFHGISADALATVPSALIDDLPGETMIEVLEWLQRTYTSGIGYEFEHLEDPESREWLREQIESGEHCRPLGDEDAKRLLGRLVEVEALEQFVHRAYLGAKRFSIEGTDMMVPMLDLVVERAAAGGAREVAIGMAHRGRLNVLAHVLGMPYEDIIGKFEGIYAQSAGTGDVKYHLGAEGTYATRTGEPLTVMLAPNPSHLEFVHAVVEGMTRAKQSDRTTRELRQDTRLVVPVIIHGDAAFSGQGVVPETLNLARLRGYSTGGTLHIIANNQVGFTTNPSEARSTDYASDIARGFDIPVFHVNADNPDACLAVVRLAMAYRERFHGDVVIDLIGYRRYGHNEGDEPAYTQPVLYRTIGQHPTVRRIWAERLADTGVMTAGEADAVWQQAYDRLVGIQATVRERAEEMHDADVEAEEEGAEVDTAVPAPLMESLNRQLHAWPADFTVHPKLRRQLEKRGRTAGDGGTVDWAHAEALAFASLLADGVPVRLTGQDTERGTFSQRHIVLHDAETDHRYTPVANIAEATAPFEVYNSPLSELAVLGFEYGFSVVARRALVLWEAQFGDFINGAQVIIDQFITAGRAKWGQESRLVLLLPHGHEGQGPEHSSARFERFLQLAAENNIRVANCTTPAQYFHLIRRQALLQQQRPLVIMTPKSLLRHPRATSSVAELNQGAFHKVIDDAAAEPSAVRRVVLCAGKVYYDLAAAREKADVNDVALVRVELLYPFPAGELEPILERYGDAELVWVQEEPQNMGGWSFMAPRIRQLAGREPGYVGRPPRASPAEGYADAHETEQARIVDTALATPASARAAGRRTGGGRTQRRT